MNIFILDREPKKCANYHCDRHVVKMPLESCQMLINAHYQSIGFNSNKEIKNSDWSIIWDHFSDFPRITYDNHLKMDVPNPYKISHFNHPASIWVRESIGNYNWLCELALELCYEKNRRYQTNPMKTEPILYWLSENIPNIPDLGLTDFSLCMPEQYKTKDPVESYRNYYKKEKFHIAIWNKDNDPAPFWW